MSEFRHDPILDRWNIIETDAPLGPAAFAVTAPTSSGGTCPFCAGNEAMTPPELHAVRSAGAEPNGPGWQLRVVANKFPALTCEGALDRRGVGVYERGNGVGAHEVIIETPDHHRQTADLSVQELTTLVQAYTTRSLVLRGDPRCAYTLLYKNFGVSAGASLEHPHTQLIALPLVPKRVQEEMAGAARYFQAHQRCAYCDILRQELQDRVRIVCQNRTFVAFCPFTAGMPFELWILPSTHQADFTEMGDAAVTDFAAILKEVLLRVRASLSNPPYNFIIHTAPREPRAGREYHWHVELSPTLIPTVGFEWGTGVRINPTSPERAAAALHDVRLDG